MTIDFNRNPYYDDYTEENKFHRILFRPSYAVQARELNQQQTILQNQISRFGNHVFKNGAMVIPGQVTFDNNLHFVKIDQQFDSENVDLSDFLGYKIIGLSTGIIAEVVNTASFTGTDPNTLFVKYMQSSESVGTEGFQTFIDGEILERVDNNLFQCKIEGSTTIATFLSVGLASSSSVEKGVYYINGFFVNVDKQSIILNKYENSPTVKVGLKLYEYLITPEDNSTLLDNAQGSYNYAAPGAHRYKLDLLLEYLGVGDELTDDFIELQKIEAGVVINEIRTSEYNELEKTFARRTYDESGDYTVTPFNIAVKEHLKEDNVRFKDGKYTSTDVPPGDEAKLVIGVEPGKAYVRGFERLKLATTWIETNKARTTGLNINSVTNFNVGSFIYVKQVFKLPDISKFVTLNLWQTPGATDGVAGTTLIGTAKARAIELAEKDASFRNNVYKLYLFDIILNVGKTWSDVLWISYATASEFTCNPVLVGGTYAGAYGPLQKQIIEPTKNLGVFKLPHAYVKTLKPGGTNQTTYTVQRVYPSAAVVGSTVTLNGSSNEIFDAFTGFNYVMMNTATAAGANASDTSFLNITGGDTVVAIGNSVTITAASLAGKATIRISVPVIKQLGVEKTKTRTQKTFVKVTPNKVQGQVDELDRADGIRLISVIDSGDSSRNITSRYIFVNGQRRRWYDLAKIQLKNDAKAPVGPLSITYEYFEHTNGDYCSVDSYNSIDYYDIPVYYSEVGPMELTDCFDFRPVIDYTGEAFSGTGGIPNELPIALSNIRADYEHYLSRIDKLYIDYTGKFSIIEGNPAVQPTPPKSPSDGMVLYELFMTAYTYSPKEVLPKFIDNKRYTMRDIGRLEKRINNLEYYTSLSLLEKETAQYQIKDPAGLDRYKNGFIVEPFKSHGIGDSAHPDYRCSIDPVKELMRPSFSSDSIALLFNGPDYSPIERRADAVKTGPLVTLDYTSVPFIQQRLASTTENVNPFAIRLFEGKVAFQPDSDNWYDTKHNGDLVVNDDAHYAALQFMATYGEGLNGVTWDDWQTTWASSSSSQSSSNVTVIDRSRDHDTGQVQNVSNTVTSTTTITNQKRTGANVTSTPETINKFLGDRTVGINYIPYMRSIPVLVKVEAMKPTTRVFPFFDDISVSQYCVPAIRATLSSKTGNFSTNTGKEEIITTVSGGSAVVVFQSPTVLTIVNWNGAGFQSGMTVTGATSGATAVLSANVVATVAGAPLVVDEKGRIALVFTIPNNNTLRFRTGERSFVLNDQVNNTEANQTKAEALFKSQGSLLQQEGTVLSTKTIRFNREPLEQSRVLVSSSSSVSSVAGAWFDPLAQTFLVQEDGGCFITACDVYFQKKDETLPVSFQIREVVNGYPSQIVVPYSDVTMYPEDIVADPVNGAVATKFVMNAPVYLRQNAEYCFVLLSDSFEYNIWIAEIGQLDILSREMISKQPYNGVLFKSQNASTWTANQDQDIKFTLYKASFIIDENSIPIVATAAFWNDTIAVENLVDDPFETFASSNKVRVHQFAHGFTDGSYVRLANVALVSYNGIPGSEFNNSFIISNVEIDSYMISTVTSATAVTGTGLTGGVGVTATRNIQMDVMRLNISELVLPSTYSSWGAKTLTSKSVNGQQNDYTIYPSGVSEYAGVSVDENNFMPNPMMIASTDNETTFNTGLKSLRLINLMQSDNRNLSPVVDLTRAACIAVANRIDSPILVTAIRQATTVNASSVVTFAHIAHGMATGAIITTVRTGALGGIAAASLTGDFIITRVNDDSYTIIALAAATGPATGDVTVTHSSSHYKYMPETFKQGGSVSAKYQTNKITVENASIGFKILITAVVMDNSTMELWYKKQGTYDTSLFSDLPWVRLTAPDFFVPLSENEADFREYIFSKELGTGEDFTSIAAKVVMKSTDSTKVPILDDLRVICLGT